MRVLLAVASDRTRNELTQALEGQGHEVVSSTSRGAELLRAIEEARPIHVALLTQAGLGGEWARSLRHLRKQVPDARAVVLLRPGAEQDWRRAMMAGAFEVLPGSAPVVALLDAVHRALAATPAHPLVRLAARREGSNGAGRPDARIGGRNVVDRRHAS